MDSCIHNGLINGKTVKEYINTLTTPTATDAERVKDAFVSTLDMVELALHDPKHHDTLEASQGMLNMWEGLRAMDQAIPPPESYRNNDLIRAFQQMDQINHDRTGYLGETPIGLSPRYDEPPVMGGLTYPIRYNQVPGTVLSSTVSHGAEAIHLDDHAVRHVTDTLGGDHARLIDGIGVARQATPKIRALLANRDLDKVAVERLDASEHAVSTQSLSVQSEIETEHKPFRHITVDASGATSSSMTSIDDKQVHAESNPDLEAAFDYLMTLRERVESIKVIPSQLVPVKVIHQVTEDADVQFTTPAPLEKHHRQPPPVVTHRMYPVSLSECTDEMEVSRPVGSVEGAPCYLAMRP